MVNIIDYSAVGSQAVANWKLITTPAPEKLTLANFWHWMIPFQNQCFLHTWDDIMTVNTDPDDCNLTTNFNQIDIEYVENHRIGVEGMANDADRDEALLKSRAMYAWLLHSVDSTLAKFLSNKQSAIKGFRPMAWKLLTIRCGKTSETALRAAERKLQMFQLSSFNNNIEEACDEVEKQLRILESGGEIPSRIIQMTFEIFSAHPNTKIQTFIQNMKLNYRSNMLNYDHDDILTQIQTEYQSLGLSEEMQSQVPSAQEQRILQLELQLKILTAQIKRKEPIPDPEPKKKTPWFQIPPAAGEPEEKKDAKGRMASWCAHCSFWSGNLEHNTNSCKRAPKASKFKIDLAETEVPCDSLFYLDTHTNELVHEQSIYPDLVGTDDLNLLNNDYHYYFAQDTTYLTYENLQCVLIPEFHDQPIELDFIPKVTTQNSILDASVHVYDSPKPETLIEHKAQCRRTPENMSHVDGYVRNEEETRKDSNPVATVHPIIWPQTHTLDEHEEQHDITFEKTNSVEVPSDAMSDYKDQYSFTHDTKNKLDNTSDMDQCSIYQHFKSLCTNVQHPFSFVFSENVFSPCNLFLLQIFVSMMLVYKTSNHISVLLTHVSIMFQMSLHIMSILCNRERLRRMDRNSPKPISRYIMDLALSINRDKVQRQINKSTRSFKLNHIFVLFLASSHATHRTFRRITPKMQQTFVNVTDEFLAPQNNFTKEQNSVRFQQILMATKSPSNRQFFDSDSVDILIDTGVSSSATFDKDDFVEGTYQNIEGVVVKGIAQGLQAQGFGAAKYTIMDDNGDYIELTIDRVLHLKGLPTRIISP